MSFSAICATPIPGISLGVNVDSGLKVIESVRFVWECEMPCASPEEPFAKTVVHQLERYFSDPDTPLKLSVRPRGTDFQRRVWSALRLLATGSQITYGELAVRLDSSPRAIGGACRANPILVLIPCHRVVARSGLGGFGGELGGEKLAFKRWLLDHERC